MKREAHELAEREAAEKVASRKQAKKNAKQQKEDGRRELYRAAADLDNGMCGCILL